MAKKVGNTYFFTGKGKSSGGGGGGGDAVLYTEQTLTESEQMQARKNQGLYYEGEGIGEKTIINPSPEYEWEYPDSNFEYDYSTFKWFIGDAPTQSEIIGIRYADSSTYIPGNSLQSAVVEGSDGKATMYAEDISDSSRRMFMVVSEDVSFGGSNHKKGIYFPDAPFDPYLYEIKYMGETTTVHTVEPKYLPISTSLSGASTDEEVPSAKTVYDIVGDVETLLAAL